MSKHRVAPEALPVGPRPGPLPGPPRPDPQPSPPMEPGALVKTASSDQVFLIAGQAKFPIPSWAEFQACGYDQSKIVTITDAELALYRPVPGDRANVCERGHQARFFVRGAAVGFAGPDGAPVPQTPETVRRLGLMPPVTLPAGALAAIPTRDLFTSSITPSSVVFPPELAPNWQSPPGRGKWWPRTDTPAVTLPNGATVLELRGWVLGETGINGADPDWHMQLQTDPAWLDHLGVNWAGFFRLGDLLAMGKPVAPVIPAPGGATGGALLTNPTIHVELNGYPASPDEGDWAGAYQQPCPQDWLQPDDSQPPIRWPFRLDAPPVTLETPAGGAPPTGKAPQAGDYVRVSGSFVTDIPHVVGFGYTLNQLFGTGGSTFIDSFGWTPDFVTAMAAAWDGAGEEALEDCPGRWSEMHPPDGVVVYTPGPADPHAPFAEAEAVYGLAAIVLTTVLTFEDLTLPVEFELWPPEDGGDHRADKIVVEEFVGAETNFSTIVAGNADKTGAQITIGAQSATVSLTIRGAKLHGVPGKFRAVYRVRWAPDPSKHVIAIEVDPPARQVPLGTPTTVTVTALDALTNAPVSGQVVVGGAVVGQTGTPLNVTFPPVTWRDEPALVPRATKIGLPPGPTPRPLPIPKPVRVPVLPTLTVIPAAPYQRASISIGSAG